MYQPQTFQRDHQLSEVESAADNISNKLSRTLTILEEFTRRDRLQYDNIIASVSVGLANVHFKEIY